jgi:hypothetical protein
VSPLGRSDCHAKPCFGFATRQSHGRPLLSYSFFEAVDPAAPADADDAPARVDVWSLSDVSFKVSELAPVGLPPADRGGPAERWCHALLHRMQDLLSVALSDVDGPQGLSRTLCIIALDLSRCVRNHCHRLCIDQGPSVPLTAHPRC